MKAAFPGECVDCPAPIVPGQEIEPGPVGWRHVTCPPSDDARALAAGRCARCGLHHPGEC